MTTKRILFITLCVLLVLVITVSTVVFSRVYSLFSGGTSSNSDSTSASDNTSATGGTNSGDNYVPNISTSPPHDHDYVLTETLAAGCESYGWNIYHCSICGDMDMPLDGRIDPLGHSYALSKTVQATCTEGGYSEFTCQRCQKSIQQEKTEPLDHLYDEGVEIPPTCGEDGCLLFTCQREGCGETKAQVHEGTAIGEHTFEQWLPNDDGTESRTCTVCGMTEIREAQEQAPLTITSQNSSVEADSSYTLHTVTVGTEEKPDLYTYQILDYTNQSLGFDWSQTEGLVVIYSDAAGEIQNTSLGKGTVTAQLDETGLYPYTE